MSEKLGWKCETCGLFSKCGSWKCPICGIKTCENCFDRFSVCKECAKGKTDKQLKNILKIE